MDRRRFIILFLGLELLALEAIQPRHAYGAWIWTPQTRRWVNPKYAAKDTPSAQMEWAVGFFESKDYPRAVREFRRLVQAFPRSELAPEAQYLAGVSYELMDQASEALAAYKKLVEIYPFSARFKDAIEREFALAEALFSGKRLKLIGPVKVPALDKAIEIYQHVVDQAPYGEYGALAQFRLGECTIRQERFEEANRAFQRVVDEYPTSPLLEEAKFNVAFCAHKLSRKPSYDQSATEEAINWFEEFINSHPNSPLLPEAERSLSQLRGFKAQALLQAADFYKVQRKPESAAIYYRQVLHDFPDSAEAVQALAKLSELEKSGAIKR
ncbi:MAG: outer membrane protein assembly factor BamD [Candidatus Omnitrophica bacterium]|nr:outer membrane protein assembly factor BamD [Candidatus Omnitrophota bacterium]